MIEEVTTYPCSDISHDARLMVCLCDLTADDAAVYFGGVDVTMCEQHKAAKLEALCKQLGVVISFQKHTTNGNVEWETLGEAVERIKVK